MCIEIKTQEIQSWIQPCFVFLYCRETIKSPYPRYDVIKWNHFPRYWPFVIPLTKARPVYTDTVANNGLFIVIKPIMYSRLQWSDWVCLLETRCCTCIPSNTPGNTIFGSPPTPPFESPSITIHVVLTINHTRFHNEFVAYTECFTNNIYTCHCRS